MLENPRRNKYLNTPSTSMKSNDLNFGDNSNQNPSRSINPDRESNLEVFRRHNPDYDQPLHNGRLTTLS
jgi:hypothetical protein